MTKTEADQDRTKSSDLWWLYSQARGHYLSAILLDQVFAQRLHRKAVLTRQAKNEAHLEAILAQRECKEAEEAMLGHHSVPVLYAFSAELFLKALLRAEGKTAKIHDLLELFQNLDQEQRSKISTKYTSLADDDDEERKDIVGVLTEFRRLFETARYVHEIQKNTSLLDASLPRAIRAICSALEGQVFRWEPLPKSDGGLTRNQFTDSGKPMCV